MEGSMWMHGLKESEDHVINVCHVFRKPIQADVEDSLLPATGLQVSANMSSFSHHLSLATSH